MSSSPCSSSAPFQGPVVCLQTSGSRRGGRDRISRAAESGAVVPKLHRAGKIDCMMGVKVPNLGSGRRGAEAHHGATRVRNRNPSPNRGFSRFGYATTKGYVVLHCFRVMSMPVDLERRAHIFYCLLLLLTATAYCHCLPPRPRGTLRVSERR